MEESKKKKILLIEDDSVLSNMYKTEFVSEGFDVTVSSNGDDGESKALSNVYDIILLDIALPKKNGLTILKHLRGTEKTKNLPVIILTNLNMDDRALVEVIENHPSFYLIKSETTPADVVNKINEVLGK